MNKTQMRLVVGAISMLALSAPACAQSPFPDPSLWNTVLNPSGNRIVPVVYFDPATEILSVDTRGIDRISNNPSASGLIQGDDVGMISLLVTSPVGADRLFPPFIFDFGQPIGWSSYYFAGRQQLIGHALVFQYVLPRAYDVYQFPEGTNLVGAEVEMAVNFAPLQPGAILNGRVQLIPEPSTFLLVGSFALVLLRSATRMLGSSIR